MKSTHYGESLGEREDVKVSDEMARFGSEVVMEEQVCEKNSR